MIETDTTGLVAAVADQLWLIGGGFGVEVVLAFPVIGDILDEPVIASAGTRDRVRVEPAQVFRYAIRRRAGGVVLGHNHPADTGPSAADHAVTRRLVSAGHVLGIPLIAHVVAEPGVVHDIVSGRSWNRDIVLPVQSIARSEPHIVHQ
ncbi:MAG: JAB domain-containing protein [Sciscionella sp.]